MLAKRVLKQTGKLAPVNKPWKLIRDAIADLEKQEKCKSVVIDMGMWHQPNGVCTQCLAGAVMSRRLGVSLSDDVMPHQFPDAWGRLSALNLFRQGGVANAYERLGIAMPNGAPYWYEVTPYESDPCAFKRDMRGLADAIEAAHKKEPRKP